MKYPFNKEILVTCYQIRLESNFVTRLQSAMAPFPFLKYLLQPYSKTEAAAALKKPQKKKHQLPISQDHKEKHRGEERKRLGTHVEKEPSSSNYAVGHYSFLTTKIPPRK